MRGYWTTDAAGRRGAPVRAEHGRARRPRRPGSRASPHPLRKAVHAVRATAAPAPAATSPRTTTSATSSSAVPRRDADVLGGDLRASAADACTTRSSRGSTASAASSSSGRATTCSRSAPAGAASRCTRRATSAAASPPPPFRASSTLARERVREAGPRRPHRGAAARTTATSPARYDKLVSIEMIEAIGHEYYDTYFAQCAQLLEPDGADAAAGHHHRRPALRTRAPLGRFHPALHLPRQLHPLGGRAQRSPSRAPATCACSISRTSARTTPPRSRTGATTSAPTCRASARSATTRTFIRMWEYYLCYCEGGFAERVLGDVQMLLVKPGNRCATRVSPDCSPLA